MCDAQKLECNLCDKEKYIGHVRTLKKVITYRLILRKTYGLIKVSEQHCKSIHQYEYKTKSKSKKTLVKNL